MTNKYTSEHFSELLNDLCSACSMIGYATSGNERQNHRATKDKIKAEIIDAIATLLRERESAKAVVTDDLAGRFHDDLMARDGGVRRWAQMGGRQREAWRQTLEAVAPMLASARVPEDVLTLLQELLSLADTYPTNYVHPDVIDRAKRQVAALLAAAPKPETEE